MEIQAVPSFTRALQAIYTARYMRGKDGTSGVIAAI
jgi:energy-coupling factor transporter transmembrane protein EcfT